ncbi:MAG: glycosyltransferase family 87 protein [Oscillochloridaceae bacterium umkhey_bin13]
MVRPRGSIRDAAVLQALGLALGSFVLLLGLVWARPISTPIEAVFAPGTFFQAETTPFLGTYHWLKPEGTWRLPQRWWTDRVIIQQTLSAGAESRTVTLNDGRSGTSMQFMVAAGQLRTYRWMQPAAMGWSSATYQIADIGSQVGDPRPLGMIIQQASVVYLAGTAAWPSLALLLLALIGPMTMVAVSAWGMHQRRWLVVLAVVVALAAHYPTNEVVSLQLALPLVLGLGWLSLIGWLILGLRPLLTQTAGRILAASVGFALVPGVLVGLGLTTAIPGWWMLLLVPLGSAWVLRMRWGRRQDLSFFASFSAGCVLIWASMYGYADAWLRSPTDFSAYYDAALRLRLQQPLYEFEQLAANPFATSYKYPPLTALLMMPLTFLPFPLAGSVWRVLAVASVASAMFVLLQRQTQWSWVARLGIIGGLLVLLSPVSRSLRFGQLELLLVAGVVGGALLLLRGHLWSSAILWALIILMKLYPLILIVPLVRHGHWRWLVALGLGILGWSSVSSLLSGWDGVFWRDLFPTLSARDGRLANLSVYGLLARWFDPTAYQGWVNVPTANMLSLGLSVLLLGSASLIIWQYQTPAPTAFWYALSLMITTMLLILPITWDHYHVWLLVPLVLGFWRLGTTGAEAPLYFMAYSLVIFGVARDIWPAETAAPAALPLLFASYRTVGVALLWVWLARQLMRMPRTKQAV